MFNNFSFENLAFCEISKIVIIRHQFGLDRPVSASCNSLVKGHLSCLLPFVLQFSNMIIKWKNTVESDRPLVKIWSMRIVFWIPKATKTLSEYVIIFHCNNGFTNAPQCYVIRTLSALLGAAAKLRKATDSVVMYVSSSVRPHGMLGSHQRDFHENLYIYIYIYIQSVSGGMFQIRENVL